MCKRINNFPRSFFLLLLQNLIKNNNNSSDCVTGMKTGKKIQFYSFVRLFVFFSFICLHKILVSRKTKTSNQNVYFLFSPFFALPLSLFLSLFRPFFPSFDDRKITIKILILIFFSLRFFVFSHYFLVTFSTFCSIYCLSADNKKNWKMSRSI